MNLYRISQSVNTDYDTFDSAVVAAETAAQAATIHPSGIEKDNWREDGPDDQWTDWSRGAWCSAPTQVTVEMIGHAVEGTAAGVILASFNAG